MHSAPVCNLDITDVKLFDNVALYLVHDLLASRSRLVCSENVGLGWIVKKVDCVVFGPANAPMSMCCL